MLKNIISGMAYLITICLAILVILMVVSNFNKPIDSTPDKLELDEDDYGLNQNINSANLLNDPNSQDSHNVSQSETSDGNISDNEKNNSESEIKLNNAVYYDKDLNGNLELPINGATGYASVSLYLKDSANNNANNIITMSPGAAFVILNEQDEWWQVNFQNNIGWVHHNECMINLPDIIPSIIYDNTNVYGSMFTASEKYIPYITGQILYSYSTRYDGKIYNERLQKYEYILPVLYSMSKTIYKAQQNALNNGDTLVIYEGYRPYETQMKVVKAVQNLAKEDPEVNSGLNSRPWGISWFIATGLSNHQKGYAIDTSLAEVKTTVDVIAGNYKYKQTELYFEYHDMPTEIHELSNRAVTFTAPVVPIESDTAWKNATLSIGMKNSYHAQMLQKYCTDAGLAPLASEWWHFNDVNSYRSIRYVSNGQYEIKECLSKIPE